MSTQHAVTHTTGAAPGLGWAFLFWQIATVLAGVFAFAFGARIDAISGATAIAIAPGLIGSLLLPRLGERGPQILLLTGFLSAIGVLTAANAGVFSPMAACFVAAPALCAGLTSRHAPEAGAASLLAYAASAIAALYVAPTSGLGAFPSLMAAVGIAFATIVIALGVAEARRRKTAEAAKAAADPIAELAHELRTPLTHIMGFAELLRRQVHGPMDARNVEYAELIHQSGAHMLDLAEDLLEAARLGAGRRELARETFDARTLVEEAARRFTAAAAEKEIAVSTKLPDAALTVNADQRALRRIAFNLIGNALKFTPKGGAVKVEARSDGELFVLEVVDTGPGISPAERERLGRPFERGESVGLTEGAGLGLSLVRALIGLHGGTLSFHDGAEGGALVRVSAPILVSSAAASA